MSETTLVAPDGVHMPAEKIPTIHAAREEPPPGPLEPDGSAPEPDNTPTPFALDLTLHPDDAAPLMRSRHLTPLRTGHVRAGRARSVPVHIIWHDTAEGTLAKRGLSLAESRAHRGAAAREGGAHPWRLERMLPGIAHWPPGAPAPSLAEGAQPDLLGLDLPSPILPWAAVEGRAASLPLVHDAAEMSLTVIDGTARTVAAQRRVCRVLIEGPEQPVVDLALALAGDFRLTLPRGTLAAEVIAAARSADPPPRHMGAPVLSGCTTVAEALARVTGQLTDVIVHFAPLAEAGRGVPEPVHQMRVAVRRLRSALMLFRRAAAAPLLEDVKDGLKALNAVLGPPRDWDVFATGTGRAVGAAFPEDRAVLRLLTAAERRRISGYAALREHLDSDGFRRLCLRLSALAGTSAWLDGVEPEQRSLLDGDLTEFAAKALGRRLRTLLETAGDDVSRLPEAELHIIRLHGKRMRYAAEFFAPLFTPKQARRFIRRLTVLQERLGVLNDGAVAKSLMAELIAMPAAGGSATDRAFAAGIVQGFVAAKAGSERAKIIRAWERFRKQETFWD